VPNPYRALLDVRGGPAFSAAAFIARLPISMLGIAIVLLVSSGTGRYGLAGAVAAVSALAEALGQPFLSRYVDRYGQSRAVPPMVVLCVLSSAAFAWLATHAGAAWTLFVTAAVAGASFPNTGAFVRARWAHALSGTPGLQTAFSLESTLDELIFVIGPPLVTWVALAVGAAQALLATVGLLVVGTTLLLVQRRTEPPPAGSTHIGGASALSVPGVRAVVFVMVMLGGVFGSFEVVTIAFAHQRGHPGATGVLLALNAAGSMIAGITYGLVHPTTPQSRQLVVLAGVVPLTVLSFPFVQSIPVMAVLSFVAGFVISPTLICAFGLIEQLAPAARLTEGLTLASTGIVLGVAVAAALSGRAVDLYGTPHAYVVTTVSGVLTAAAAWVGRPWLVRRPAVPDLPR
jgi:predicted MFS family arabinose efflux permease